MIDRLKTPQDVEAWGERLRAERLNDTGRAMIDLAVEMLLEAVCVKGLDKASGLPRRVLALARVAPHVAAAVRDAYRADKSETDRSLVKLRRTVESREAMADRFDEIH